MRRTVVSLLSALMLMSSASALADDYTETTELFKNAGESASFFANSYGYAVFPTIAKAGLGVGGGHGKGRVYERGKHVGDVSVTQLSFGLQAGGQAFSQIIFFEDDRAFKEFTSGNFEFGADVGAVAITASASARAGTTGTATGASAGKKDATTAGKYRKGMAVFTICQRRRHVRGLSGREKFWSEAGSGSKVRRPLHDA